MCIRAHGHRCLHTWAHKHGQYQWGAPALHGDRRAEGVWKRPCLFSPLLPAQGGGGGSLGQLRGKHQLEVVLRPEVCPRAMWVRTLDPQALAFDPQEHKRSALFTHSEGDPSWSHFLI